MVIYRTKSEADLSRRRYSIQELAKWPFEWSFIKSGRDSGFPWCCIVWFKIRYLSLHVYELIFGNCGPFGGEHHTFYNEEEYLKYINSEERQYEENHILCPYHKLHKLIFKPKFQYFTCEKCGWIQFKNKICKRC